MAKNQMNLQDSFLNQVRKENVEICITLLDGNAMKCFVRGFDNFTIIVHTEGRQHLVYKHAIAQIEGGPIRRRRENDNDHHDRRPERKPHSEQAASGERAFNTLDLSKVDMAGSKEQA